MTYCLVFFLFGSGESQWNCAREATAEWLNCLSRGLRIPCYKRMHVATAAPYSSGLLLQPNGRIYRGCTVAQAVTCLVAFQDEIPFIRCPKVWLLGLGIAKWI